MFRHVISPALIIAALIVSGEVAGAQAFRVQCPAATSLHPTLGTGSPTGIGTPYTGYTNLTDKTTGLTYVSNGGVVRCQQVSGGDGYATMADGTQIYLFAFGPLSGIADIANGLPGTEPASIFNTPAPFTLAPGDPATSGGALGWNGAVGLAPDLDAGGIIDGHVDPRPIMDVGVMNGNHPAPLMAIDEDDEFFLTLSNVGMIMRPDLFEQHTIHFHGYPNASSFYDGVPDASVAINIGGSFTYYYLAPDAGTYFWHCHISPPEHLQMGMVGRSMCGLDRTVYLQRGPLSTALQLQQSDLRTACEPTSDILCTKPLPARQQCDCTATTQVAANMYAYNDGDGSTAYDVEYPLQIHGFDPELPLCRHDLQSGRLRGHEGQIFPVERTKLSRHGDAWSDADTHPPMARSTSRSHCLRSSTSPPAEGAPAHFRPGRHGVSDPGFARYSDEGDCAERQAAARSGGKQHVLQHEFDHAGWRRIAGCDSRRLRYDQVHPGQHVLPVHPQSRSPVKRRRELRRVDDRSQRIN